MEEQLYGEVGEGPLEASVPESEEHVRKAYKNGMDAAEFADAPEAEVTDNE